MDEMMKTIAAYKMDEVAEMLGHGHEMNEIINMMEHRKKLEDEISKQRYYGKVEMIMNLIRIENRSMSIVVGTPIDEIAEWSGLREEELLKLRDIAYSLDETIITRDVCGYRYRRGKTREEHEAFEKLFWGMYGLLEQSGIMFTALLALYGEETAYGYAKLVLEMNGIVNEDKLDLFQKKLMEFAKLYVLRVGEWLQENNAYPYDIIASAMVYYFVDEKTFRRLLQHFEEAYEGGDTNE